MSHRPRPVRPTHAMLFTRYGTPLRKLGTPVPQSWVPLLDAVAVERGIARTDLVREIIEAWLRERGLIPG